MWKRYWEDHVPYVMVDDIHVKHLSGSATLGVGEVTVKHLYSVEKVNTIVGQITGDYNDIYAAAIDSPLYDPDKFDAILPIYRHSKLGLED